MDLEKKNRRQSLKVIFSEAIMVLTVAVTVIILGFVVSGYWVNADFEVKRQGMLQISSIPTGADVEIDHEASWLQKTNTSKVLTSGEHTINISKEGYDTWSKTINIREGLLYRVRYPRLFLKEREVEDVLLTTGYALASFSPDHTSLILIDGSTEWLYINTTEENISPKKIDVSEIFSVVSLAPEAEKGLFLGQILDIEWDKNNSRALFKVKFEDKIEWVLLNPKEIESSRNLNKEFSGEFTYMKILNNDANSLLAVQDGNLHKIDVGGKSISAVLVNNVLDYDFYHNEIVFSALDQDEKYYVGKLKIGDNKITTLKNTSSPVKVAIFKFYEDKFILTLEENLATLYKEEDFEVFLENELSFSPTEIKVEREGEFIFMNSGPKIAAFDMEELKLNEWAVDGEEFGWIDNYMVYSVNNGELVVYDFDGLNRRVIANNASSHFPVAISKNRFLYYFSDNYLVREWLIPR